MNKDKEDLPTIKDVVLKSREKKNKALKERKKRLKKLRIKMNMLRRN